ncbi:MAG TPA: hypothetical protein VNM24_04200 [Burkholderiales bacterium]|jgi:hypothetical protein|nr:hypothetical protein [Burkholderiales bacterium]
MTVPSTPVGNRPGALARPPLTAAQHALLEHKVLSISSLQHGAYYGGYLDNTMTTGRWHAERRRFIFWENGMPQPQSRATPHVADLGTGPRFAPLWRREPDPKYVVSDFAFVTTR